MRRLLFALAALQGIGLIVTAGVLAAKVPAAGIRSPALLAAVAAFALGTGVLLLLAVRDLRAGRRWPRTPLGMAEFLAVVVSTGLVQSHRYGYAAVVGLPALAVLLGLLTGRLTGRLAAPPATS